MNPASDINYLLIDSTDFLFDEVKLLAMNLASAVGLSAHLLTFDLTSREFFLVPLLLFQDSILIAWKLPSPSVGGV